MGHRPESLGSAAEAASFRVWSRRASLALAPPPCGRSHLPVPGDLCRRTVWNFHLDGFGRSGLSVFS